MPRDPRLQLDDILEAAGRIRDYTDGLDADGFCADRKTQDAVIRNLEIIGEAARALPEDVRSQANVVAWRRIVGFRNVLVHEYFGVNLQIAWDAAVVHVPRLERAVEKLLAELDSTNDDTK